MIFFLKGHVPKHLGTSQAQQVLAKRLRYNLRICQLCLLGGVLGPFRLCPARFWGRRCEGNKPPACRYFRLSYSVNSEMAHVVTEVLKSTRKHKNWEAWRVYWLELLMWGEKKHEGEAGNLSHMNQSFYTSLMNNLQCLYYPWALSALCNFCLTHWITSSSATTFLSQTST